MAEGNSQYAVDVAKELSRQLDASKARVAELEDRVADLETRVRIYRHRSEQAEQWLNKISSELRGRVAGKSK
jgi:phage shock protein A